MTDRQTQRGWVINYNIIPKFTEIMVILMDFSYYTDLEMFPLSDSLIVFTLCRSLTLSVGPSRNRHFWAGIFKFVILCVRQFLLSL